MSTGHSICLNRTKKSANSKSLHFIFLSMKKAGDGNRTHVSSLEGWCSTIELHPRLFVLSLTQVI